MDYSVHDGVVNSLVTSFSQNVTKKGYPPNNCPSGAKSLTIGSRLSLTELLEVSNPDLLVCVSAASYLITIQCKLLNFHQVFHHHLVTFVPHETLQIDQQFFVT
jgi:hypothetical protein